jgi:ERCC4-related helicase
MEFDSNHVLLMTMPFFSPDQLNLLVFDECHAAVKDAPMKQVLSKLKNCKGKNISN